MRTFADPNEFAAAKGETLGPTDWVEIDQVRVDTFAEATGDHQWIHVDPERAKSGPFGGTIAHGFLTLSLLPELLGRLYTVENVAMGINYGLNKVRFPSPVPVGARVRLTTTIADSVPGERFVDITLSSAIEVEGGGKPACVIESIARLYG
ncbi:MaoC family dehydratase [Pseudonocardia halophobica]|uniref:MaoC family dehydratase n=1 Tax=Pseudonocardia halophobica TaxID=29401 RepID=A0A9W6NUQ0_9PSEU|nr:MaoC family dehydratase [Pseudonocardia halophobica]GLL09823.1 MaoC family dehydratase [Pseudonocardia halophobica]